MGSSLSSFLNICENYKQIVISGPQRSGTTYTAWLISMSLNYDLVDETRFNYHSEFQFNQFLYKDCVVIQAPSMSHLLADIDTTSTLVVFMLRDNIEIAESEDRIGWHPEGFLPELLNYKKKYYKHVRKLSSFDRSAPMKKWVWNTLQKPNMLVDYIEKEYYDLEGEVGWVDKEFRSAFEPKQIKLYS